MSKKDKEELYDTVKGPGFGRDGTSGGKKPRKVSRMEAAHEAATEAANAAAAGIMDSCCPPIPPGFDGEEKKDEPTEERESGLVTITTTKTVIEFNAVEVIRAFKGPIRDGMKDGIANLSKNPQALGGIVDAATKTVEKIMKTTSKRARRRR